jgi:hypothetical protein
MLFSGNQQGGDQYVMVRQVLSWTGAQVYCRKHHTDLVSIRNPEENQAVWDAFGGGHVLIGLFKDAWHWSDKRNSSFRLWEKDSFVPLFSQSCAVMTSAGSAGLNQRSCAELHPFFCTCK